MKVVQPEGALEPSCAQIPGSPTVPAFGAGLRLFDHGLLDWWLGRSWARKHQRDHLRLALMLCDEVWTQRGYQLGQARFARIQV